MPKFSGPAHVIFVEILGNDLTIEGIFGRRVLSVQPDLHDLIKHYGGYANISPEAIPWRASDPLTGREQGALKKRPATARNPTRRARA